MTQYKKFKIGASYVVRGHLIENNPNGIFVIMPTKRRINAKDAKVKGMFNYVSRGTTNNGIASQIQYNSQYLNDGHTLSFAQDTAAIFYQGEPYFTGNKVNVFKLNDKYGELTRELGLYLVSAVRSAFPDFKWGMMLNIEKIANTDILLPVTPAGDPDFEYMTMRIRELEAERIRELEAERIRELEAYLRVTGLDATTLSASEAQALTQNVKWKRFRVGDLFDIDTGSLVSSKELKKHPGKTPRISVTTENNGIVGYYDETANIDNIRYYQNFISVNFFGNVFYHPEKASVEMKVHVLHLKSGMSFNRGIALYLVAALSQIFDNGTYNYGNQLSSSKLKKENYYVALPVTPTGDIDFDYMQNYIRATEKQTIKGVVEYKDRVIAETKKVVGE